MKTRITLLFALLLALVCTAASAQEYYTLPEIREQAAQGWHETYTDKYGRTVSVDIDVEVYGEETASILKVGFPMVERYSIDKNTPYESDRSIEKAGGRRLYIERMGRERIDLDRAYGIDYGNDLTVHEVYEFLNTLLVPLGLSVEDFAFEQPEAFEVISVVKKNTGETLSPAFYLIDLCPQIREMPIYTHAIFSVKAQGWPSYTPRLYFQMRNNREYALTVKTLIEKEEVVEDIPLCSLDVVIENLKKEIEVGYIQKVDALRFGYSLYNDPNYSGSGSAYDAECYYAVPSWVITCVFSPDPKKTIWDEDRMAKRLEEGYDISNVQRDMVINAQTGEMIDYFDRSKGGKADTDYKGFVSWDDVR